MTFPKCHNFCFAKNILNKCQCYHFRWLHQPPAISQLWRCAKTKSPLIIYRRKCVITVICFITRCKLYTDLSAVFFTTVGVWYRAFLDTAVVLPCTVYIVQPAHCPVSVNCRCCVPGCQNPPVASLPVNSCHLLLLLLLPVAKLAAVTHCLLPTLHHRVVKQQTNIAVVHQTIQIIPGATGPPSIDIRHAFCVLHVFTFFLRGFGHPKDGTSGTLTGGSAEMSQPTRRLWPKRRQKGLKWL